MASYNYYSLPSAENLLMIEGAIEGEETTLDMGLLTGEYNGVVDSDLIKPTELLIDTKETGAGTRNR